MRITIQINTDNAAWDDCPDQLDRVIAQAVECIKIGYDGRILVDINGNRTGYVEITDKTPI